MKPVIVLSEAEETEKKALQSWARGLEWVQWMLSGVRQRLVCLHWEPEVLSWTGFVDGHGGESGRHLIDAWQAAAAGDLNALQRIDSEFGNHLSPRAAERSRKAGAVLLKNTNGARYQGMLGKYRQACAAGDTPGHFVCVWGGVGDFFHLSAANLVAEYLRLEWAMGSRDMPGAGEPKNGHSIASVTSRYLKAAAGELRLIKAARQARAERESKIS